MKESAKREVESSFGIDLSDQHKCKLYRLKNGDNLRSQIVVGFLLDYPRLNSVFRMVGNPLEIESGARLVRTSPVREIRLLPDNQGMILITDSGSEYLLESNQ